MVTKYPDIINELLGKHLVLRKVQNITSYVIVHQKDQRLANKIDSQSSNATT
jgi:hypothetical protein